MDEYVKPGVENLKKEGLIRFLNYDDQSRFDKIETLIDKDLNKHTYYGVLMYPSSPVIDFEIYQKSNIYAYGLQYGDGSGSTPEYVDLYIKTNDIYTLLKSNIKTKVNEWYLLFENLEKGIYQVKCRYNYVMFTEWYTENIEPFKYLINQNNQYYTLKDNRLTMINTNEINENKIWFENIDVLNNDILSAININYSIIKIIE